VKIAVISSSNRAASKSRLLANCIHIGIQKRGIEAYLIDLGIVKLPEFDPESFHLDEGFNQVKTILDMCDGFVLCSPIYNWSLSSELKKCIEVTGAFDTFGNKGSWYDKIVTFACVGAIEQSYMSWGQTAVSLMMDFKCIINPYSIYGLEVAFSEDGIVSPILADRIERSLQVMINLMENLKSRSYQSKWEG
jgi:FMN reductase